MAADGKFSIHIVGSDVVAQCSPDERVLDAIERAVPFPKKPPINVGCRRGGCGACRIRVLRGDYRTDKLNRAHVSEQEEAGGYSLACRTYALSDLEIEAAFISPAERMAMRQAEKARQQAEIIDAPAAAQNN